MSWHYQSWRHSMAARGISTRNRRYAFYERLPSRGEIKRVKGPLSRKAALLEEEEWLESVLQQADDLKIDEGTRGRYREKLADVKEQLSHVPSSPPRKKVGAAGDLQQGLLDRFEFTSGKRPGFVKDVLGDRDKMPDFLKEAREERMSRRQADERAEQRVIDVMGRKALYLTPEELEDDDLLDKDVLVKDVRRSSYAANDYFSDVLRGYSPYVRAYLLTKSDELKLRIKAQTERGLDQRQATRVVVDSEAQSFIEHQAHNGKM